MNEEAMSRQIRVEWSAMREQRNRLLVAAMKFTEFNQDDTHPWMQNLRAVVSDIIKYEKERNV